MVKNVGLIGCGYWGKNYVNTIRNIPDLNLKYVCDFKEPNIMLPERTKYTKNINDVLKDKNIDGVIVATPTISHYDVVSAAIKNKKNVLVEKPITLSSAETEELISSSNEKNILLMVGHIFKYNNAVRELKRIIENGEIGELRYIESRRVGLGPIRNDASVLWDFASHDIYISEYLAGDKADSVSCIGISHNRKLEDIANLNLIFKKINVPATIYVNWEHPVKERKIVIGGSKKAILFDDVEASDKLIIYERGVDFQQLPETSDFGSFQALTRIGDTHIPRLKINQPLEDEIRHFKECMIDRNKKCDSDGYEGLRVVRVLEAAEKSMSNKGKEVRISK